MFWNKKKKSEINIKITRTADQYKHEKQLEEKVFRYAETCPNCGHTSINNRNKFGYECGERKGYFSTCAECGTKWETEYRL